jgi:FtsP/CotA-like multicopper oxidase with cupredoxin domain
MKQGNAGIGRRDFLKAAGVGAAWTAGAAGGVGLVAETMIAPAAAATTTIALAATDGYVTVPERDEPLYIFGFIPVNPTATVSSLVANFKGHAQTSAPTLDFRQGDDIKITLTNLGLIQRPDLTDSHTVHWHGFDLPSPLNDGVPEVSIAVPIGKQFTYFYRPHREGTYMWHCHFEDVEHVQMGMTGIVFVRPTQDGSTIGGFNKFAYNDGDGSTGYDRHFAILMNEFWSRFHDGDHDIQESVPTDYDPEWFILNGRCYPQTTLPNDNVIPSGWPGPFHPPSSSGLTTPNENRGTNDRSQPNSSLVQINAGERGLLRLANLGYQQHSMQLPGITMHVVGQDASLLRNGATDISYLTDNIYIGPGEARDVLFDAPPFEADRPSGTDSVGAYNVYYFKNRDWRKLSNNGAPGPGGMMTEVRVYPTGTLPAQVVASQTYV